MSRIVWEKQYFIVHNMNLLMMLSDVAQLLPVAQSLPKEVFELLSIV